MDDWIEDGKRNGWIMPSAPWWKRLPVIRHVRALVLSWRIHENEWFWSQLGMVPSGYDRWVLHGIWRGMERRGDRP